VELRLAAGERRAWSIAMRFMSTNMRLFITAPVAALVLSAGIVGASRAAEARFLMPGAHMPLARGPVAHGPVSGARRNSRLPADGGRRIVRVPPQHYHAKLRGRPIETVASRCGVARSHRYVRCGGRRGRDGVGATRLPVSTDFDVQVAQARRGGGGGSNNSVPPGERRFVPDEVLTEFSASASSQAIAHVAGRFNLIQLESQRFDLIGSTIYRWRIGRRSVPALVNALGNQSIVAAVQPNYLFTLQGQIAPAAMTTHGDPAQYVLGKLEAEQAHQIATGKGVLVAVIDSAIDAAHPDLGGSIIKNFDALGGKGAPQLHGTEMAGAIAAHGKLLGVAPSAELLAVRAFDNTTDKARGTSFDIFKSLQWAADNDARIVNMSFAGPADPALHRMLAAAYEKDIVLIAAAGNDGPYAAPAYPAADPHVIAVTATDADDNPFKMANRGKYVAVAAPGVEIVALAPDSSYGITTGTSVAAAHVTGIAALLLQRDPLLKPADVRGILAATTKPLRMSGQDTEFGAGIVDAFRAVMAPQVKALEGERTSRQRAEPGRSAWWRIRRRYPALFAGQSLGRGFVGVKDWRDVTSR
jgi:subtilisin family serine protease